MELQKLQNLLFECYSKDLCYPKISENWSENNRCYGMCAITALIVDDYYNTEFGKIYVDGISHYFNVKDSKIIDLTSSQFNKKIDYSDYRMIDREAILANKDTRMRYLKLKQKLELLIKDRG